jgi:hypothetical protein
MYNYIFIEKFKEMEDNNKKSYIKRYTNKKGEVKEYTYDQHNYYKKYYETNKDKTYKNKYKCEICNAEVLQTNKTNHFKSMKHINNIIID